MCKELAVKLGEADRENFSHFLEMILNRAVGSVKGQVLKRLVTKSHCLVKVPVSVGISNLQSGTVIKEPVEMQIAFGDWKSRGITKDIGGVDQILSHSVAIEFGDSDLSFTRKVNLAKIQTKSNTPGDGGFQFHAHKGSYSNISEVIILGCC